MMDDIEKTDLYRSLAEGRSDVELWEDNCVENGGRFFWIVAFSRGNATILAQVRTKDGQIEHCVRDEKGNDVWIATK